MIFRDILHKTYLKCTESRKETQMISVESSRILRLGSFGHSEPRICMGQSQPTSFLLDRKKKSVPDTIFTIGSRQINIRERCRGYSSFRGISSVEVRLWRDLSRDDYQCKYLPQTDTEHSLCHTGSWQSYLSLYITTFRNLNFKYQIWQHQHRHSEIV